MKQEPTLSLSRDRNLTRMESVDNPPLFRGRVRDLLSIMAWIVAAIHWQPCGSLADSHKLELKLRQTLIRMQQEQQPPLMILRCTDRLMILLISGDEGQPQYWEQFVLFHPEKWHFWFFLMIHVRYAYGCTASQGPCIMFPECCHFFDQQCLRLFDEGYCHFFSESCDLIKSILQHYVECAVRSECPLCREVDENIATVDSLLRTTLLRRQLGLLSLGSS